MITNCLTVPARLDSLDAVASLVLTAAQAAGLNPRATYRLRLAVDEFVTNIILHGYAEATTAGTVDVRIELDDEALGVVLEDTGVPFDARQLPPPNDLDLPLEERRIGGLGIFLALEGVDDFAYERIGNRNRNRFVMNRRRAATTETELPPMPA